MAIALGKKLGEYYPSLQQSFDGIGGAYGDTAEGYTRVRTARIWEPLPGGWEEFKEKGTVDVGPYRFNGIAEGDTVYVESQVGRVRVTAKLSEGIHPDVVAMCYGQGHWAYGRWARDKGANPNEITGVMYEHITGMSAYFNTRVKVYKVCRSRRRRLRRFQGPARPHLG